MRAGRLDRNILLQEKTVTQNSDGQPVETWATIRAIHAQQQSGAKVAERFANNQLFATVTTVFRCGFWPAFAEIRPDTHRILYRSVIHNIQGAIEIGRKDGVEILCDARGETV